MAARYLHICPNCGFEVEAWDDGNQYILDDRGQPHFFYHPGMNERIRDILSKCRWAKGKAGEELDKLIQERSGNMSDFICLDCCKLFRWDVKKAPPACSKCRSTNISKVMQLAGKACPKCRRGNFPAEPRLGGVS